MLKEQKQGSQNLTIITTHVNADFDALASMLAAQKLYPDALVVFPGSQEKNLKNFFINSMAYLFNMADIGDIDFKKVKRLVLVDTRQPGRIGKLSELLKRKDIEIHIYDHHPSTDNDIKGDQEVHRMSGANVTLLIEIISQRGIDISDQYSKGISEIPSAAEVPTMASTSGSFSLSMDKTVAMTCVSK